MTEILKTTQSNYSRWEREQELISLNKLNLSCNYFSVDIDYVIGFSEKITFNEK